MICHYCQQPVGSENPRWVMGEPCCDRCHVIDGESA